MEDYIHKQKGLLHLFFYVCAVIVFGIATYSTNQAISTFLVIIGILYVILGSSCHYLLVVSDGENLIIRFGPLPLFSKTIPFSHISKVEPTKSTIFEGFGIHYTLHGLIYNLWGFKCVRIVVDGESIRIGTDEPGHLIDFIHEKID